MCLCRLIQLVTKPSHFPNADFSFIHSRFLSPLPPTVDEFKVSLRSIFPYIIDLGHLMKEISPLRSMNSLPAASSFLRNRFFAPVDIDIPLEGKFYGFDNYIDTQTSCCSYNIASLLSCKALAMKYI